MKVLALDHVQLAMPAGEETRARGFYSGVLGLPEQPKPPDLAALGGAWFQCGSLKVHLGVDKNFIPARKAHPAFVVDDLDGVAVRLRDHGYPVVFDGLISGLKRLFTEDPFRNRIELIQESGSAAGPS
jgi:catechol 2,3-dioxygenase-like lactoylglutathione lyase family enzyme